jgi:AcrR family transcriptional regulator
VNWLTAINPNAPYLALTLISWAVCWALRTWAPTLWSAVAAWGPPGSPVAHLVQALPSVVASAVVAALGTGLDPWAAAKGAAAGLLAPLLHHALKVAPVPYRGALKPTADGPTSRRIVAAALRGEVAEAPRSVSRSPLPKPWGEDDEP